MRVCVGVDFSAECSKRGPVCVGAGFSVECSNCVGFPNVGLCG